MITGLRSCAALARSVLVYHGDRARHRRMDALYRHYVQPGDLAFDIGSHVGDRISAFRRLGARVVALEPQPGPAAIIRLIHGRDRSGDLPAVGGGRGGGELVLRVNSRNPTVSSLSADFVSAAQNASRLGGPGMGQNADGARHDP